MPSLQELDTFERQLGKVRAGSNDLHVLLGGLLNDHARLLEDYRSLKSDYEEEKAAREKYKRLARGPNNDPFVLVLVDGNSYIFNEQLLKDGEFGGAEAAQLLLANIKSTLRKANLQTDRRIVVRIFANLNGLSKLLARYDMVGKHARSITNFTASFSQTQTLFDVIDSGDNKDGLEAAEGAKIEENFRMFAGTSVCEHIIFAACNDPSFLSLLGPYQNRADKITLIRSGKWIPEFSELGLPVEEYTDVFRTSPLGQSDTSFESTVAKKSSEYTSSAAENAWVPRRQTPSSPASWAPPPFGGEDPSADDSVTLNRPRVRPEPTRLALRRGPDDDMASLLPTPAPGNDHLVPINKYDQRVDTYLAKPSPRDVDFYHRRSNQRKLCNDYHLDGWTCPKGRSCPFDHGPVTESELLVLRAYVREWLCPLGGACRVVPCNYGHVCVRKSCLGPVRNSLCRLLPEMHDMDFDVAAWVPGVEDTGPTGFVANAAANTRWNSQKVKGREPRASIARLGTSRPAISPGHELGTSSWWRRPEPIDDSQSVNLIDLSESSEETASIHHSDDSSPIQPVNTWRSAREPDETRHNDYDEHDEDAKSEEKEEPKLHDQQTDNTEEEL